MKTTTAIKMAMGFFVACAAVSAMATDPTISDVVVRQRWPWSRLVDINYVLSCETTQRVDVAVTGYNGATALSLSSGALSGDLYGVSDGSHRIVWDPTASAYTNSGVLTKFRVQLTPTEVPVYMIVDLTKAAGADGQIEYIYPGDARLETYGRFTNVWFGVTNDSVYATDKLVLRRVHAGTFKMGDSVPPTISTTLTKEFYAGVFEVTQRQWELITGAKPSFYNNLTCYASRPVEQVSYEDIRGASNSVPSVNWPVTDRTVVSTNSFLSKLWAKTGLTDFDLPTEAQWECLCRAGTATVFNDGNASANVNGDNANTNAWLDALGRYQFDGGHLAGGVTVPASNCGSTNGTAVVGSYQANAWGLYDTHGNVWELCLDWYPGSLAGGSDPAGAVSGSGRVRRGGSWDNPASYCRSASRLGFAPANRFGGIGFRLVRTLP
jgi:formylglycine-generating enzyme required for sulfatase activity